MKTCKHHGVLTAEQVHMKKYDDRRYPVCSICLNYAPAALRWKRDNKPKIKEAVNRYQTKNKERFQTYQRAYYALTRGNDQLMQQYRQQYVTEY